MPTEWIALACAALLVGSPSFAGLSIPQLAEDSPASELASEDEGDDTDDDDEEDDEGE